MFQEWLNKYNEIINKGENMEEDIKILEEMCNEIIEKDDCNLFETLSPLEIALKVENLIKGYRKLEKEIKQINKQLDLDYVDNNFIPKSKIEEEILNPMKEEHDKAINEFMKKEIPHCISGGDVAQTLGHFIGKIEELLEEE